MVVTEVWLEVKNGRATVVDAQSARRPSKRSNKKRKANQRNASSKKRKLDLPGTEARVASAFQDGEDNDSVVRVDHANLQLFAEAQEQLQLEMTAAGFDGDALPLSFGSTSSSTVSQKRKRQRNQSSYNDPRNAQPAITAAPQVAIVQTRPARVALEKVHVKYDSDGEVSDRHVETVVATVSVDAIIEPEVDAERAAAGDAVETEASQEIGVAQEEPSSGPEVDPAVFKFWKQRRTLFHKYDEGVQLDRESWYSVTPESIAQHIATRCACDVIVDPFSGCGGNIIQFAQTCKQVIAIEIDADKIRMAKANAAIYGVADKIEWIHGDALQVLPTLQADVVFLSPPWGGMDYNRQRFGIEEMMIGETSGVELFEMARRVAKDVVYYLPKTTPEADLQALAPDESVECEHIHLNGQLKVVNAYYGDIACTKDERVAPDQKEGEEVAEGDDTIGLLPDSIGQEEVVTQDVSIH